MAIKYIIFPFATTGNRTAVPDGAQGTGALSWTEGYGPDYELDPANNPAALLIARGQMNQFLYDMSSAIQQYQQFGTPNWISSADNAGSPFPYAEFARVIYTDGAVYESLVANNTALPTDPTSWAAVPHPATSGLPAGLICGWGGTTAPTGWLLGYGQLLSRTTFAALFANIGTNFGVGDGSTTFAMPDFRGRTIIGKDDMGGTAANRITNGVCGIVGTQIGAAGGDQNMQAHTHFMSGVNGSATSGPLGAANYVSPDNRNVTSSVGSGGSQNVQPSLVCSVIIKT